MLRLLLVVCGFVWMAADGRDAKAQTWPERPITLIHGFGAGGNADSISRLAPLRCRSSSAWR
jgi:tripartite-type tricarboxylate transporter receptor subunit TctC